MRRRARPELRPLGDAGAEPLVRPPRLRRDASGPVRVGRAATRGEPGRGRSPQRSRARDRRRRGRGRAPGVPHAHGALRDRAADGDLVRQHLRRPAARVLRGEAAQAGLEADREAGAAPHEPRCVREAHPPRRRSAPAAREPAEAHPLRRPAPARDRPRGLRQVRGDAAGRPAALLSTFAYVDTARQVVGVGSVGMLVYLLLLEGRGGGDPLFLQVKQAGPSVYEAQLRRSRYRNHGRAGRERQAPHPERDRHLRRVDVVRGHGLLRPPVPRHEDHPGQRADRPGPRAVRDRVRRGRSPGRTPAPGTLRRSRDTSARAHASTRRSASSLADTRTRPSATTPSSSMRFGRGDVVAEAG